MNLLTSAFVAAGEADLDDNGQVVTSHWLFPDPAELLYGTLASLAIFAILYKFAGPPIKKAFVARTERIQAELDAAAAANAAATAEAVEIRTAKGDIDAERQRLFAEADANAEARLADGRERLEREVAELEARAAAELVSAAERSGDELRADIASAAAAATERVVGRGFDDATQQQMIESFIQRVGASA